MAIRGWHYGKLIILWAWGIFLTAVAWYVAMGLDPQSDDAALSIFGLLSLAFVFAIPAALSCVTWHWLGGKERVSTRSSPQSGSG